MFFKLISFYRSGRLLDSFFWLLFLLIGGMTLLGCQPQTTPDSVVEQESIQSDSGGITSVPLIPTEVAATAVPTETALPSSTATSEPTMTLPPSTLTPTLTPAPEATDPLKSQAVESADLLENNLNPWPEIFYLAYGFGSFDEPVLQVIDKTPQFLPSPAEIEVFFEYEPNHGLIVYGRTFWETAANGVDGVTDLYLYRFEDQTEIELVGQNVGRASWAIIEQRPFLLVALHDGAQFNLVLFDISNQESIPVDDGVSLYFEFFEGIETVVYVKDGNLYGLQPMASDEPVLPVLIEEGVYDGTGWIGDKPTFIDGPNGDFVLYPADPFLLNPVIDGGFGESFVPTYLDASPLNELRPLSMLYSSDVNQLIVQEDGMGSSIRIYQLSEDLTYVLDSYTIDGAELVGWIDQGDTILLLDINYEPKVWSLTEFKYIETVGNN